MKQYFDENIIKNAIKHFKSVYPDEGCGLIIDNEFVPVDNIAEDKSTDFKIDTKYLIVNDIQAVVHSHVDYPHASKKDMIQQIATAVPWGIVNFNKHESVTHTVFWGDQLEPQELLGRPFFHGIYDCYGLVRDYYREKGILLKKVPRENRWWETEPSMLENGFKGAGFKEIDISEAKKGDMFFCKLRSKVVNHSGILLDNGLILHHLYNRLSLREPIGRWSKYITGFYRYKGVE